MTNWLLAGDVIGAADERRLITLITGRVTDGGSSYEASYKASYAASYRSLVSYVISYASQLGSQQRVSLPQRSCSNDDHVRTRSHT